MTDSHFSSQIYAQSAIAGFPRLSGLMDSQPFSKTFGSFCRAHWHHRLLDFPSAINQLGFHTLALAWKHPLDGQNFLHQNPRALKHIKAAVLYCIERQHSDGSWDEWYPNERGWAGPTGYLAHAMVDTYKLIKDQIDLELENKIFVSLKKACDHLLQFEESHVLANHHAIAYLPVLECAQLFNSEKLFLAAEKLLARLESFFVTEEGWSLEYDGADPAYQSATLSFLSRAHAISNEPRIEKLCRSMLPFLANFCFPDGNFVANLGSRQTSNCFVFGIEYWADKDPIAERMAQWARQSLSQHSIIEPTDHEDHYFLYRMPEFIEAAILNRSLTKNSQQILAWEKNEDSTVELAKAKFLFIKTARIYAAIDLGRGGALRCFDLKSKKRICFDDGWWAQDSKKNLITPLYPHSAKSWEWRSGENQLVINGRAQKMGARRTLTPLSFIIHRLLQLMFGWNRPAARQLKNLFRQILMFGAEDSGIEYQRKIQLSPQSILIDDTIISTRSTQISQVVFYDLFETRHVPQSRYSQNFHWEIQSQNSPDAVTSINQQKSFNQRKTVEL